MQTRDQKVFGRVTKSTKDSITKMFRKLNAVDDFPEKYQKRTGVKFSFQSLLEDCINEGEKVLVKKYKDLI